MIRKICISIYFAEFLLTNEEFNNKIKKIIKSSVCFTHVFEFYSIFSAFQSGSVAPMMVHSTPLRPNQEQPAPALDDNGNSLIDMGFGPEDMAVVRREAEQHFNHTLQYNAHVSQLSNILAADNPAPVQPQPPNIEDEPIRRRLVCLLFNPIWIFEN